MQNKWIIVGLTLVVGFLGGMLVGKYQGGEVKKEGTDTHAHVSLVEVPEGALVPTVDAIIHEDPKGGYNVQIVTTNFTFAPERASTEHVFGEGHAHIYVDGVKINRVYGEWYHLASLGNAGEHTIKVELSANDHSTYAHNGVKIEDTETVMTAGDAMMHHEDDGHDHEGDSMEHDSMEMHSDA